MLGSSRVAAQLAASQEGLSSMSDDDDDDLATAVVYRVIYLATGLHVTVLICQCWSSSYLIPRTFV
jgi:hypothetical protein